MGKKKALLMLTGGRGITDLLVIKCLQPDIVLNITTVQGLRAAQSLKDFVYDHFNSHMEILVPVNPYDEQEIKIRCNEALQRFPDAEWVMHFTSSPKVIGIYAHDVARERNIPYLFLDTGGEQIVSLVNSSSIESDKLFHASIEEYIGAYGRRYEIPKSLSYRQKAESYFYIAHALVHNLSATQLLLEQLRKKPRNQLPVQLMINQEARSLIELLASFGVLTFAEATNELSCVLTDNDILEFLRGDWLEVYVWHEACKAGFADDCRWGYKIVADLPSNELDVVLTYKARLLIAECKTSKDPFSTDHLYKIHSVADLVGGNYVRQVFVTNIPRPQKEDERFANFCEQAKIRRISVITGEQLPDIGNLLMQQIGAITAGLPLMYN